MQEQAKLEGKQCTVPKIYIPPVDTQQDEIEKQNKASIQIYRDQMSELRSEYGDSTYFTSD